MGWARLTGLGWAGTKNEAEPTFQNKETQRNATSESGKKKSLAQLWQGPHQGLGWVYGLAGLGWVSWAELGCGLGWAGLGSLGWAGLAPKRGASESGKKKSLADLCQGLQAWALNWPQPG